MKRLEKVVLGGLGGLSAVLVKFLGQDYGTVVSNASNLTADQMVNYQVAYALLTPMLMFLGAFFAWITDETNRMKVVALAIAAPAMVTTWSGGQKGDLQASLLLPVSSAYAQGVNPAKAGIPVEKPGTVTEQSTLGRIQSGIGVFFGYGKEPKKYWVIVGSFKDRSKAQQFADKINAEDAMLNAWIGVKVPPNDYFPVIVGTYSYLSEAKELQKRALATQSIKDAYLSSGAQR
jgi:hypothetical protein